MTDEKDRVRSEKLMKLSITENQLIKLIADTDNEKLMGLWLEFQNLRNELLADGLTAMIMGWQPENAPTTQETGLIQSQTKK